MSTRRRRCRTPWVLAVLAACGQRRPEAPPFAVQRVTPELGVTAPPLLLNDAITVYFTAPVDPLSVTPDTVAVLDEQGNRVPGRLRSGGQWIAFEPAPPVGAELLDGSLQPGAEYRFVVAGYPRPDGVRSADGRRLGAGLARAFRTASRDAAQLGLPAPLRPPPADLPFLLRPAEGRQTLPVDAPRLRLHFTLPVLPPSAVPEAFEVSLLRRQPARVVPRSVRILQEQPPADPYPGCTVELDLGAELRLLDGSGTVRLRPNDDIVFVQLAHGERGVRDYGGRPVQLAGVAVMWDVAPGASIAMFEWPQAAGGVAAEDPMLPGLEVTASLHARPRVRVEAGDGSLGVFRPRTDTVLRPGQPFDRGDGTTVVSRGTTFPFLAVDVPAGVTVRVAADGGPVQILSCGGIRIAGDVVLDAPTQPLHVPSAETIGARDLVDGSAVAFVAAGDVLLLGRTATSAPLAADRTALTVVTAGSVRLDGEVPQNTVFAYDAAARARKESFRGARGGALVPIGTVLQNGVPEGVRLDVAGCTPWRQLPIDRDSGVLRLLGADSRFRVAWQAAPPDPVRTGEPDLRPGRVSQWRAIEDRGVLATSPGAFVRFRLEAAVTAGEPLPRLERLQLLER